MPVYLGDSDITSAVQNVSVRRGRSLETDTIDAGTAVIEVDNTFADFNPYFYTEPSFLLQENNDELLQENGDRLLLESGNGGTSGTYGDIQLGQRVTVVESGATVFTGFVEDYDYTWAHGKIAKATIEAVDSLATLGATSLNEWTTPLHQSTGERLVSMLDRPEVSYPASTRDIDTGTQPVQPQTISSGLNALQYAQEIARTESGQLFVSRTGDLTFRNRYAAFGLSSLMDFNGLPDAGDAQMSGIEVRFGTESFYFSVTAERVGGEPQSFANAGVASQYPDLGGRNLPRTGLLFNSEDHTLGLAQYLTGRLSEVEAVVSGMRVPLNRFSAAVREAICSLDIGGVVSVTFTPLNTTGAVSQNLLIEGVEYGKASNTEAFISFRMSNAKDPNYFEWDVSEYDGPDIIAP